MDRYENVILVGAVDRQNEKAVFSNYGSAVDLYCPGVAVNSVVYGETVLPMSGTSMAGPFAANLVGTLLDANVISKRQLIEQIAAQSLCVKEYAPSRAK